jgi:DNA-binding transcriptional MocR family regulator
MLMAIERHLPGAHVEPPKGGLFIWVKLPAGVSSDKLLSLAVRKGVEFAPGVRFTLEPAEGESYLRLNFATQTEERIELGIERLAKAIQSAVGGSARPVSSSLGRA